MRGIVDTMPRAEDSVDGCYAHDGRSVMMITTTRTAESTAPTSCLLLAFELGQRSWKLGFSVGMGQRPRIRQIPAGAVGTLATEIERAKKRLGLPADSPVMSCYEGGPRRLLVASISGGLGHHQLRWSIPRAFEVNRRARRAKTDRLGSRGPSEFAGAVCLGDRRAWRVVRVPTVAEEDARHLPRTLEALTQDHTRLMSRLKSLLVTQASRSDQCAVSESAGSGTSLGRNTVASRPAGATDPHVEATAGGGWTDSRPEGVTTHAAGESDPPRRAMPSPNS